VSHFIVYAIPLWLAFESHAHLLFGLPFALFAAQEAFWGLITFVFLCMEILVYLGCYGVVFGIFSPPTFFIFT
jgi:hypothetical protein